MAPHQVKVKGKEVSGMSPHQVKVKGKEVSRMSPHQVGKGKDRCIILTKSEKKGRRYMKDVSSPS